METCPDRESDPEMYNMFHQNADSEEDDDMLENYSDYLRAKRRKLIQKKWDERKERRKWEVIRSGNPYEGYESNYDEDRND